MTKDELREEYRLGKEAFQSNNYEKAKKHLMVFAKDSSSFADVFNMLGVIFHVEGKLNKAASFYKKALDVNPNYIEAAINMAIVKGDRGEYQEAKKYYDIAQKHTKRKDGDRRIKDDYVKSKLANLHLQLGDLYSGLGVYVDAIEEYRKALKLKPKFVDIKNKLAMSLKETGEFEEAISELKDALRLRPHYSQGLVNLGLIYYAKGDLKDAKKIWEKTIEKFPDNKFAVIYLKTLVKLEK